MLPPIYPAEPRDTKQFTSRFDKFYARFAPLYDLLVKVLPLWRNWLRHTLPYLQGPRILEVSFGTGYLLTQFPDTFEIHGADLNARMLAVARENTRRCRRASLLRANVSHLPYADECMDTVVNTMAFSGYPDGRRALAELARVLRHGGRLVLLDINYPENRNWLGMLHTRFWIATGDIIRDMRRLFAEAGLNYEERAIGGFGSVHLYLAEKG